MSELKREQTRTRDRFKWMSKSEMQSIFVHISFTTKELSCGTSLNFIGLNLDQFVTTVFNTNATLTIIMSLGVTRASRFLKQSK